MVRMATPPRNERKGDRKRDRHAAHKMLRVPMDLYDQLVEIAAANERPVVWEARIALRRYIEAERKRKQQGRDEA